MAVWPDPYEILDVAIKPVALVSLNQAGDSGGGLGGSPHIYPGQNVLEPIALSSQRFEIELEFLGMHALERLIDQADDPIPAIDGERHNCLQGIAPPEAEHERAAVLAHRADVGDD